MTSKQEVDVDLDAARKARAAQREGGDHLRIRFGGKVFNMPPELPLTFGAAMMQVDVAKAADILFGDNAGAFLAFNPTTEDLNELVKVYGLDVGEALASTPSLRAIGNP